MPDAPPGPTPDPTDPAADDCFAPPAEPCECYCLHCQRVVNTAGMWYQRVVGSPDRDDTGFWMCPTPNCGGAGFTFDIFPTDPDHPGNAGWTYSDDDDEWDEDEDAEGEGEDAEGEDDGPVADAPYDPAEPAYAGPSADDPEAFEGEEWKHGLSPGDPPPESPDLTAARAEREAERAAEQRKYDEPDRRPRVIDRSGEPRRPPPAFTDDHDAEPPF